MSQTAYDEELKEDLEAIRRIVEDIIQFESVRRAAAEYAMSGFAQLTPEDLEDLSQIEREGLEVSKELVEADNIAIIPIVDFASFPVQLEEVLAGEVSEEAYEDFQDWRVDIIDGLEELELLRLELLQQKVRSPYELISLLYESFKDHMTQEQKVPHQKWLKFLAKHEDEVIGDEYEEGYWKGVASLAHMFSVVGLFLVLILKWVNFALDDYEEPRAGEWQSSWSERFKKVSAAVEPLARLASKILEIILRIPVP